MKTPRQRLNEAREEIAEIIYNIFHYEDKGKKPQWLPGGNSLKQDEARDVADKVITSTLQAFIEAEIERLEGEKEKKEDADYYIGYNQAKEETIKHLKELLETKR